MIEIISFLLQEPIQEKKSVLRTHAWKKYNFVPFVGQREKKMN